MISEDKQQWKLISKLLRDKVEGSVDPQKVQTAAPMAAENEEDESGAVEGEETDAPRRPERRSQRPQQRNGGGSSGRFRRPSAQRQDTREGPSERPRSAAPFAQRDRQGGGFGRQQGVRPNGTSRSGDGHKRWNRERTPATATSSKPREFDRPLI